MPNERERDFLTVRGIRSVLADLDHSPLSEIKAADLSGNIDRILPSQGLQGNPDVPVAAFNSSI